MQVSALRNGNPGIVPPHLLKPMPDTAPATPAPVAAATPERPETSPTADALAGANAASGTKAAGRWIPIIIVPDEMPTRAPMRGEQQATAKAVGEAQRLFSSLGVSPHEGNDGNLNIEFIEEENAAYSFDNDTMYVGRDGYTGRSFAEAKDVIAHEYSHRIIDRVLKLEPGGETGVMHESLADTFASVIDNDWTIGEDIAPGGMRDMLNPERFGDPGHVSQYVRTAKDDGGVHINNGIPNKAAALIGEQLGRQTMGQIYMDAMKNHMSSNSGIVDTARATLKASAARFGTKSEQTLAVAQAWDAVGVLDYIKPSGRQQRPAPQPRHEHDGRRVIILMPR